MPLTRLDTMDAYREAARRLDAVKAATRRRIYREAEAFIGEPYCGCRWHNACVSWDAGNPWAEFGRAKVRAVRRLEYRERKAWDTFAAVNKALWNRFLTRNGWGNA